MTGFWRMKKTPPKHSLDGAPSVVVEIYCCVLATGFTFAVSVGCAAKKSWS